MVFLLVNYGISRTHTNRTPLFSSVNQQLMESIMDGVVSKRLLVNGVPTSLKDLGYRFVTFSAQHLRRPYNYFPPNFPLYAYILLIFSVTWAWMMPGRS